MAIAHSDDAVDDGRALDGMGGHDDGNRELGGGTAQEIEYEVAGGGVEIAGGFVGEKEARVVDEGTGDGDALLLTAGELVRKTVGEIVEFNPAKTFGGE